MSNANISSDELSRLKPGFTLSELCVVLGVEVPDSLTSICDKKLRGISIGALATFPGDVFFCTGTTEKSEENARTAFSRGAVCLFAQAPLAERLSDLPCVEYRRPRKAAISIAAHLSKFKSARTLAITGSVGKTSAKEMARLVCESQFNTEYSKSNHNGFPQVVRYAQHLPKDCDIYIQEVGMGKPGSVERAGRVLSPNMFVITNIGLNHVAYYGGRQEGILEEKLNLDRMAADDAVGFVNWDDPLLHNASYIHRVVGFGINSDDADVRAENIVERNGTVSFDAVERETGNRTHIVLNIVGRHNVYNALCAFAIGRHLDIPTEKIVRALAAFRAEGVRQNLIWLDGYHVFLDCYNASEGAINSVASTLETIDPAAGGKRVLVLGDIDDKLGDVTEEVHRRVGTMLAERKSIDLVVFFGDHMAWAAEEASSRGVACFATTDRGVLERFIRENTTRDDVIAFKGGQQMRLPLTVDNLYGSDFYMLDGDMTLKETRCTERIDNLSYRSYEGFGSQLLKCRVAKRSELSVAGRVERRLLGVSQKVAAEFDGMPVRRIGTGAFARTLVNRVILPQGVQVIGRAAFHLCKRLTRIDMPSSLRYIGVEAFKGCSALKCIEIPEGVGTICSRAFVDCTALKEIKLPASLLTIADDMLEGTNAHAICPAGSYAQSWCEAHGIEVTVR